jgi:hypothetical protein
MAHERHLRDLEVRADGSESTTESTKREWRRPALRKLPIAATTSSGGTKQTLNEGQGRGKGDSGGINMS